MRWGWGRGHEERDGQRDAPAEVPGGECGVREWLRRLDPGQQPMPQTSRSDHMRHLGEPDEPKLLGQEGVVAEADLGPDGLVDGAVAEVHPRGAELQVRGGDYGVDSKPHGFDLKCGGQAHPVTEVSLRKCFQK